MAFKKGQGGRPRGIPNKVTREVKTLAGKYSEDVIERLGYLALHAESEQAQIAAGRELLDRAYGKPPQAHTDGEGGPLIPATVVHQHIAGDPRKA